MCQMDDLFGLLIAFTQASFQHHGPYLLKRGQELVHCLQQAVDEDPQLHVRVLIAADDGGERGDVRRT